MPQLSWTLLSFRLETNFKIKISGSGHVSEDRNVHIFSHLVNNRIVHVRTDFASFRFLLPSAPKLQQGNIFTGVLSVISFTGGGGGCLPQCMMGYTPPPRQVHPRASNTPRQVHPLPHDGHCSGRYASYLNAFLLINILWNILWKFYDIRVQPWN